MATIIVNEKQAKCLNKLGWTEEGEYKPWWKEDEEVLDKCYTKVCPNCLGWGWMAATDEECDCCLGLGYIKEEN